MLVKAQFLKNFNKNNPAQELDCSKAHVCDELYYKEWKNPMLAKAQVLINSNKK